jgi:hypothetical protein
MRGVLRAGSYGGYLFPYKGPDNLSGGLPGSLGACGTERNLHKEMRDFTHIEAPAGVCRVYFCNKLSLFQNPVGFGTSSWKNRSEPGFSVTSKVAVPKLKFWNSLNCKNI